eukprot:gene25114-30329_t
MESSNWMPRQREKRSNFDITPDQLPLPGTQPSPLEKLGLTNIKRIFDPVTNEPITYISVIDKKFQDKLDAAMEKNFDYIERKELAAAQAKANPTISLGITDSAISHSRMFAEYSSQVTYAVNSSGSQVSKPRAGAQTNAAAPAESSSVYVSNLPKDITEEELDILFSPHGKVRKIKIYVDKDGVKKGDALVTYVKPEAAYLASLKVNNLDIGEGYIIKVAKATFQKDKEAKDSQENDEYDSGTGDNSLYNLTEEQIWSHLPAEATKELKSLPVVFLSPLTPYPPGITERDVEADLLLLCCSYGNIKYLHILPPSFSPPSALVAFDTATAARECREKVGHEGLYGHNLFALVFLPPPPPPPLPPSLPCPAHLLPQFRPAAAAQPREEGNYRGIFGDGTSGVANHRGLGCPAEDSEILDQPVAAAGDCGGNSNTVRDEGSTDVPSELSSALLDSNASAGVSQEELESVDAFLNSFL